MLASIGMPKKKKRIAEKSKQLTVIELKLFAPTNRKYPRYDYEEIKKRVGIESDSDGDELRDPDAEAIVKRLEEKYGSGKPGSSKKRKNIRFAPEDVMDKGIGYDLTDAFIDDTEAYDEWVPSTMDTAKRGHYVNKGVLEFKQIDSDESDSEDLSESDEDEESEKDEEEEEASTNATLSTQNHSKNELSSNLLNSAKASHKSDDASLNSEPKVVRLSQQGVPPTRRLAMVKRLAGASIISSAFHHSTPTTSNNAADGGTVSSSSSNSEEKTSNRSSIFPQVSSQSNVALPILSALNQIRQAQQSPMFSSTSTHSNLSMNKQKSSQSSNQNVSESKTNNDRNDVG